MELLTAIQSTEVSTVPPVHSLLLKRQMPGLDILRGVAVLAVVIYHGIGWVLPDHKTLTPAAQRMVNLVHGGWLGVQLFFVLSGFLITGILLDTCTRNNYWKSFYIRRALRIVPLYLVTLLIVHLLLHLQSAYIFMSLLYLANMTGYFPSMETTYGPFWSLSVEEQFYLIWPLLVRYCSRRALVGICVLLIIICPILRGAVVEHAWLGQTSAPLWLYCDGMAWGALIALFLRSTRASLARVDTIMYALGGSSLLLFGLAGRFHLLNRQSPLAAGVQLLPFLLLFTLFLCIALRFGDKPFILRISVPIRFFGYISYGLYLLHAICFVFYDRITLHFAARPAILTAREISIRFLIVMTLTSCLCFLSRRYCEEWFLGLKEKLAPNERRGPALQPTPEILV